MKYTLTTIAVLSLTVVAAFGQSNSPAKGLAGPIATPVVTNGTTVTSESPQQQLWDGITGGATNWFVTVDAVYAAVNKKLGAEGALVYEVSPYVLVGPRILWFDGGLYLGTVNATFQLPFQPIKTLKWLWVSPLADVGTGYDSKHAKVLGIAEAGGAVKLLGKADSKFKGGLLFLVGKYTSQPGYVYTAGPYFEYDF